MDEIEVDGTTTTSSLDRLRLARNWKVRYTTFLKTNMSINQFSEAKRQIPGAY